MLIEQLSTKKIRAPKAVVTKKVLPAQVLGVLHTAQEIKRPKSYGEAVQYVADNKWKILEQESPVMYDGWAIVVGNIEQERPFATTGMHKKVNFEQILEKFPVEQRAELRSSLEFRAWLACTIRGYTFQGTHKSKNCLHLRYIVKDKKGVRHFYSKDELIHFLNKL